MSLNMQEPQLNLTDYTPGAPDVTVVMAVKNGARFLERSIRSILCQTLRNFELIVVDDGSDDRTAEILDRFGDARMRIVTQPNRGLAGALNRGVSLSRATLVARMDADDLAGPERLEKQLDFLAWNPEVGVVGSATTMINENDDVLRDWVPAVSDGDIRKALIRSNQFAHASVMFRKPIFDAVGGYSDMPFAQDYDLWLRMAPLCDLANMEEPLLCRRETAGQFGTGRETQQIRWAMRARLGAMKRGDYSPLSARHMLKPAIAAIMPGTLRELVRRKSGQKAA